MRILITNDDGYQAKGIKVLVDIMKQFGEVTVIAPKKHQSGMSMAVSLGFRQIAHKELGDGWHYVDATPASCVKFGLNTMFLDNFPDVVVSGINHGSNAAINVVYSGTMGATFEGCAFGIPSIGFSLTDHNPQANMLPCKPFVQKITKAVLENGLPADICLNVNIPNSEIPPTKMRVVRACKGN